MVSGYIVADLLQKVQTTGVRELICKPSTVDDLCAAVVRFDNAQAIVKISKSS